MDKEKIKDNNICLHKLLTTELVNKHSIGAFMALIEMGREAEVVYKEELLSVTHKDGWIFLLSQKKAQKFSDVWSIVVEGVVNDDFFINCWDEMTIKNLF